LIILTTAAVVFGISGVVAAVNQYSGDDAAVAREDAADAAGAAAETIFTYDWNKLKKHVADSQATMTPRFARKFESVSPALTALAPQRRIQMKAVVRHAATVECGDKCAEDKAKVLVFIDQARVADGIKKPTVFGNRMEMSMVLRGGDWLVDDVRAL
jgi:Mce-associated membrane protein